MATAQTARPAPPAPRICRTREEAFQAGWDDAEYDRPPSEAEVHRIAALWRPYYQPRPAA